MSSISRDIKTKCPYCGKEFETTIYMSVDPETDPDLKERCLSGDIFRQLCPHCHAEYMTQYPLIYKDAANRFVIWLSTVPLDKPSPETKELAKQGFRLRRTETIAEFTEKLQIFEDRMNDVAVELAKYDSFIEFLENRKGNPEDVTSIEYQKVSDDVMKINIRTGDKGMSFLIPVSMLMEEIEAESDVYRLDEEEFPVVNREWVISLFMDPSGQA